MSVNLQPALADLTEKIAELGRMAEKVVVAPEVVAAISAITVAVVVLVLFLVFWLVSAHKWRMRKRKNDLALKIAEYAPEDDASEHEEETRAHSRSAMPCESDMETEVCTVAIVTPKE